MNYTDFIRLFIIAYILYKLLLLKKNNEKYTQKLLHKGDKHLTRIRDRQNYKADLYEEDQNLLEKQKEKAINEAFKYASKEVAYFRPDDSDNVHYPLKRHFQLHELMGGKCLKNVRGHFLSIFGFSDKNVKISTKNKKRHRRTQKRPTY